MLFNSLHYLIFFPSVVVAYFILPHKYRWILLLSASLYFYMVWRPEYIILIIISVLFTYLGANKIAKITDSITKKRLLVILLVFHTFLLGFFKYFNFFNKEFVTLSEKFGWSHSLSNHKLLLPLGISFYTFQAMAYLIDVYRKKVKPEKNYFRLLLYIIFFPQLVAGPIERASHLLHQFYEKHLFDYERVTNGIKLIGWGLFKKLVIADRAAIFVNVVYSEPTEYMGISFVVATVLFAFQIYCDFSGYSDIAIGSAQVLGFNLMENFRRPYFAKSIGEFWNRWHISLSTWFRDYIYIPLGGNRVALPRWSYNILITFLLSGLWHGAAWTFIIWGAIHGLMIVIEKTTKKWRRKIAIILGVSKFPTFHSYIQIVSTFFIVTISWIFFRAESTKEAWYIFSHFFTGIVNYFVAIPSSGFFTPEVLLGQSPQRFIITFGAIAFLIFVQLMQRKGSIIKFLSAKPIYMRWPIYVIILWSIIFLGQFGENQFIYFVF